MIKSNPVPNQHSNKYPSFRVQFTDLGLILLTIIFFNLSFPGGQQPWLAWVVLVPLGVAIHGKNIAYVFRLTLSCALFCWLLATWWVVPGVAQVASSSYFVVIPFMIIFCLCYALPYAVSAALYVSFKWTETISGAVKGALLWTSICCLVPHILPGNVAHSQYLYPRIIQIVEQGGVPILFFFMHLSMFLVVTAIVMCRKSPARAIKAGITGLAIPLILLMYGDFRLGQLDQMIKEKKLSGIKVGMIQPNVSVTSRSRKAWFHESSGFVSLTERLLETSPALDLIVWPEIPPPISYIQQPEDKKLIDRLIRLRKTPMVISGYQTEIQATADNPQGYYNVAEFIRVDGSTRVYHKQKLLPFGEYLPLEKTFPWLRALFPHALRYLPGQVPVTFNLNDNIHLLPLICYEIIFPEVVKAGIASGGNIIVNPVDDAWFGQSTAPEIHLALALFRSVEFRMPIIRASNSGSSVLINFTGKIVPDSKTDLFKTDFSRGQITVAEIQTTYQKIGNGFLWFTGLMSVFFVFKGFFQNSTLRSDSINQN